MFEKLFSGLIGDVSSEDAALALCLSLIAPVCEKSVRKETSAAYVRAYDTPTETPVIYSDDIVFDLEQKSLVRINEHLDYLKDVSATQSLISEKTAALAVKTWWAIWEATNFAIAIPAASTGPDGKLFYEWDRGDHHFEIEFIPDLPAELFYRNRATGALWGDEYVAGTPLSPATIEKLKLVA